MEDWGDISDDEVKGKGAKPIMLIPKPEDLMRLSSIKWALNQAGGIGERHIIMAILDLLKNKRDITEKEYQWLR